MHTVDEVGSAVARVDLPQERHLEAAVTPVLRSQRVPIVQEPGIGGALHQLPQAAHRVVGQGRGLAGGGGGDQPVLGVIDVGVGAIRDEVAACVVGVRGRGDRSVLVQPALPRDSPERAK